MSSKIKNLLAIGIIIGSIFGPLIYTDLTSHYEKYAITVKPGDSLFSLMDDHQAYGDVWDSIHQTRLENNLDNNYILQPGEKLTLVVRVKD